ncbi:hypothetical protein AAZX31_20G221200 [Glycine max]
MSFLFCFLCACKNSFAKDSNALTVNVLFLVLFLLGIVSFGFRPCSSFSAFAIISPSSNFSGT